MSELTKEKIYKSELIKAGATGNNNLERIRSLAGGGGSSNVKHSKTEPVKKYFEFIPFNWNDGITFMGRNDTWTDGENVYLSYGDSGEYQYVLDKKNKKWIPVTWNIPYVHGDNVWTDGTNIYYSEVISGFNNYNYVLDRKTKKWIQKNWNGLTNFYGNCVWTDGTNIYYSHETNHYVLNRENDTWEQKNWNGLTNFEGYQIWTDGVHMFYSQYSNQYVLEEQDSTWVGNGNYQEKSFSFAGEDVWTDGEDIYTTMNGSNFICVKGMNDLTNFTFGNFLTAVFGSSVWTDGEHLYMDNNDGHSYEIVITKGLSIKA